MRALLHTAVSEWKRKIAQRTENGITKRNGQASTGQMDGKNSRLNGCAN